MASPLIQFRAIDPMNKNLESRTQLPGGEVPDAQKDRLLSETARRDLDRFYKALPLTLYGINLSYNEAMLIVDALNGYHMTAEAPHLLAQEVSDAIEDEALDKRWSVDRQAIIARLKSLSPIECLAVTDAVERWWIEPTYHISEETETYEQRCIRVGLIRPPRKSGLTPQPE